MLMADSGARSLHMPFAHGSPLVTPRHPQGYLVSQLKGSISPKMTPQPRAVSEASPSPDMSQPPCPTVPTCLNRSLPHTASLLVVPFLCPDLLMSHLQPPADCPGAAGHSTAVWTPSTASPGFFTTQRGAMCAWTWRAARRTRHWWPRGTLPPPLELVKLEAFAVPC